MKVALVHDCLTVYGGAERILEQMLQLYPDATLFALIDFFPEKERPHLSGKRAKTTFLQKMPFVKRYYRAYLPFMPFAIEQLCLSEFDLIISISYAVAKGIITRPGQKHICICCTPMRYIWELQGQYFPKKGIKSLIGRYCAYKLRQWDLLSSFRVTHFVAISNFIKERIESTYRRESHLIYPPVAMGTLPFSSEKKEFYLTASRLVSYKRVDLIVDTFAKLPDKELVVIGTGPEYRTLLKKKPLNCTLLGFQPNEVLHQYMKEAKAFIYAAEEDFGIVMVEALACGTPVIAYGRGGALEIVVGLECISPTGIFFKKQSVESLQEAIALFEKEGSKITSEACRLRATYFSNERFRREITSFIGATYP